MKLKDLIQEYLNMGYEYADVRSKVCQDIILLKISKSPYLNNITIKGGVVMHNLSNDLRRATRDIDLDFIRYSLDNESIIKLVKGLDKVNDGIKVEIVDNKIEGLNQQDYHGKRIELKLTDKNNYSITTKLDLGVHNNLDIKQEELVFSLDVLNESVVLLANSKEQIFVEKLKSLLIFGRGSTRYKDILDFYFLINNTNLNKGKLYLLINDYIFLNDKLDYNNMTDISEELIKILNNQKFIENMSNIKNNWLEVPTEELTNSILNFVNNLSYENNYSWLNCIFSYYGNNDFLLNIYKEERKMFDHNQKSPFGSSISHSSNGISSHNSSIGHSTISHNSDGSTSYSTSIGSSSISHHSDGTTSHSTTAGNVTTSHNSDGSITHSITD